MRGPKPGRRLGIVGCGAIGSLVARLLERKKSSFRVTALFDTHAAAARKLTRGLKSHPKVCEKLEGLFPLCDIVLEAASVAAALPIAISSLKRGKPVVIMSTGGFLLNRATLSRLAERTRTKIYLPSGALCGLDGVKAARQIGRIGEARITTTKPPVGFLGAPGLSPSQSRKLPRLQKPLILFQGGPLEAIRKFPANVNVAATLALALGRPGRLKVEITADPGAKFNQHRIHLSGEFGELTAETRNRPSRENPKTSALAIQAALALFERLENYVEVGS